VQLEGFNAQHQRGIVREPSSNVAGDGGDQGELKQALRELRDSL